MKKNRDKSFSNKDEFSRGKKWRKFKYLNKADFEFSLQKFNITYFSARFGQIIITWTNHMDALKRLSVLLISQNMMPNADKIFLFIFVFVENFNVHHVSLIRYAIKYLIQLWKSQFQGLEIVISTI